MKLCILTTSYPRRDDDDAGIFVKRLVEPIVSLMDQVILVVPHDADEPDLEVEGNLTIDRFKYGLFTKSRLAFGAGIIPNIRANPLLVFQLPTLIFQMMNRVIRHRESIDIVWANWVLSGMAAYFASFFVRVPYVVTIRGSDVLLLKNFFLRMILRRVLSKAARVIVVSKHLKNTICIGAALSADKVTCIENGVGLRHVAEPELSEFAKEIGILKSTPHFIFVGTVQPVKRIEIALRLLALPELSDWHMLICGRLDNSPYVVSLRSIADDLGVRERVRFIGVLAPVQVPLYLGVSQFYVTASSSEGRPNSVLEAMSLGVPVLASDILGHREIVQDGVNGVIFQVDELSEAAGRILEIQADLNKRQNIVENAKNTVKDFSWEKAAEKYVQLFGEIKS